ncbi:MAG: TetR/AcrR family transcriptional regulator [Bacteroidales bacterium]|jgi:AcrR family transcriptional regulator|nr:TetR/AcrR family transcriptional regulator [Bacteroidales bacterium]
MNDVKQRILLESAHLMLAHGIKVMTMDELAKRIGVSKRTIYEHFQDKDTLLTAVIQYFKKETEAVNKKILQESPTVIHAIFHFLTNNIESLSFSQLISRHDEIKRYHPVVYEKEIVCHTEEETEDMKKTFKKGIKQEVFRKDLDVSITASLLQASIHTLLEGKKGLRKQFSLEDMYYTYLYIFIRGCCTAKGLEVMETIKKGKGLMVNG